MLGTEIQTKEMLKEWEQDIRKDVDNLRKSGVVLKYNIIQVTDRSDSNMYVNTKKTTGDNLDIITNIIKLDETTTTTEDVVNVIKANEGIPTIIQEPIPPTIDRDKLLDALNYRGDVDGFTPMQQGLLAMGSKKAFVPATALGVIRILKYAVGDLTGKKVCVVSRSHLIGKPLIQCLLNENAYVTVLHSKVTNRSEVMRELSSSDVVVTGCGKRKLFNSEFFRAGQTLIDCSMYRAEGIPKVGDMDKEDILENVKVSIASGYGHTGPATVMALMHNVVQFYKEKNNMV